MNVLSRAALCAAGGVLSLFLLGSCKLQGEPDSEPPPPSNFSVEARYAWAPPGAPLPPGAREVTPEELERRFAEGTLVLAGPEAEREAAAREAAQDAADRQVIADFERLHPNVPSPLPALQPVQDGSVRPLGDGNFELDVALRDSTAKQTFITLGERFRLRQVAQALRQYPTRENQLETYRRFYTEMPGEYRERLQLPPVEAVALRTADEIRQLNDDIAGSWRDILAAVPKALPVLPPSCDRDEGAGSAGDRHGNKATCGYSDAGVMKNFAFPGKQHVSCVKDQARRGTCPSFAVVSTMEWSVHQKYGRRVNLNEQALYARMKLTWGKGQTYGDGSSPHFGFNRGFAEGYFVPFENQWDYNPSTSRTNVMAVGADGIAGNADDVLVGYRNSCTGYAQTCSDTTHQTDFVCADTVVGTVCGYLFPDVNAARQGYRLASSTVSYWNPANRDLSLGKMILAVGLFGSPVTWSFDVQASSWTVDVNGFVTFASATETARIGGHAVHAVGVITNGELAQLLPNALLGSGGGYFIVKNSWSDCWGDGGFAYVPFDSVKAYSLEMVSAPPVQ